MKDLKGLGGIGGDVNMFTLTFCLLFHRKLAVTVVSELKYKWSMYSFFCYLISQSHALRDAKT